MMDVVYEVINMVGMYVCFILSMIIMAQRTSYAQKNLLLAYICAFIITVADALEFTAHTLEGALNAVKFGYIGKLHILLYALLFVTTFTKVPMKRGIAWAIEIFNTMLLSAVMTCEHHQLFYTSIGFETLPSGRSILVLGHGPLFYLWEAEMMIGIIYYCTIAVRAGVLKGDKETRIRGGLIIAASIFPGIFMIVFALGAFKDYDPMTMAVTAMCVLFYIAVRRYGLLDTVQLAKERVLEDTRDGLVIVDEKKLNVLYCNEVATDIMPGLKGRNSLEIIEKIFDGTENVIEKDGKRYEIRISEVKSTVRGRGEIQAYIAWIFDMTFISEYTNEVIRLKEATEKVSNAKTNFLTHMSHEIRTPMNAIMGYANLALLSDNSSKARSYMASIVDSSKTMLGLINEILDVSKIESGKMELVPINYAFDDMISELYSMMEAQAKKAGLFLNFEIDENIPKWLYGDRVKLHEIMMNLINNSIKYTKEGSVILRIRQMGRRDEMVLLHIEVEDTGIGIEKKNFGSIFNKFEQFDKEKNYHVVGSGLGLSIVKSYVEMMDGRIYFDSEYGKGTIFTVDIWQKLGTMEESKSQVADTVTKHIAPGRILVVDDNDLNCEVATGILECLGLESESVESGEKCLERLDAGERYDIILMDHMMPDMDGVETLEVIRSRGGEIAKIPVVLLTANAISGMKEKMLDTGFDGFLTKPIDIDELQAVLIKYLGLIEE